MSPLTAVPLPRAMRLASHAFSGALVLLAWVLAHRIAYALGGADHDPAAHHGYLPLLELGAAAAAIMSLAAFAIAAWRTGLGVVLGPGLLGRPARLLPAYAFGATTGFVLAELAERSFAALPPLTILVLGLLLQAVLTCAAALAARRLLRRVGDVIAALRPAGRRRHAAPVRIPAPAPARPRIGLLAGSHAGRAPPAV